MPHTCHATGCSIPVPPKMFMCKPHWFRLPRSLRNAIWENYRPGQEKDWKPSAAYCKAAKVAVEHLAALEGKEPDTILYDRFEEAADAE